jgi:hypothetical protein
VIWLIRRTPVPCRSGTSGTRKASYTQTVRWITVATLVVVGFIALVGLARFLLPAEQPHDGSSAVLVPGQSPSIYREDAHVICKSKGVEQIASEHEVAPGPEAAARAHAREY